MSGEADDFEAWRAAVRAREARERAVDEVAEAAIRAGLDGTLSWAQVDDVLTGLGYGQEADATDGLRSPAEGRGLTQDERAVGERRATAEYRTATENAEVEKTREFEPWMEVER